MRIVYYVLVTFVLLSIMTMLMALIYFSVSKTDNVFEYYQVIFSQYNRGLFLKSLLLITSSWLVMMLLSLLIARLLLFLSYKLKIFFSVLFALPIFFPGLISAHAFIQIFSDYMEGYEYFFMCLTFAYVCFPFVFLVITPTFLTIPCTLVESAQDLGCREFRLWLYIFLPHVKHSALISFISITPHMLFDITIPDAIASDRIACFSQSITDYLLNFSTGGHVAAIGVIFITVYFASVFSWKVLYANKQS